MTDDESSDKKREEVALKVLAPSSDDESSENDLSGELDLSDSLTSISLDEIYLVMVSGWKLPPDMKKERDEFHKRLKNFGKDKLERMPGSRKNTDEIIKLVHYRSKCGDYLITLVNTSNWRLFKEAEYCHYSMPLNVTKIYPSLAGKELHEIDENEQANLAQYTASDSNTNLGIIDKIMKFFVTDDETDCIATPFRWEKRELFANIEDPDTFFRSSLKSFLTHQILIRTDVSKKENAQHGINNRGLDYLKLKGVYTDVFILHDRPSKLHRRKAFKEKDEDEKVVDPRKDLWDRWRKWYRFQPLWKIRNYFGEKIAYYFAWIELYTLTLIPVTIIGIIVFFCGLRYRISQTNEINVDSILSGNDSDISVTTHLYTFFTVFNNPGTPWFSFVLCLWGTIFVEQWKRRSNSLKYDWDVCDFEQLEPDRPQFYGLTKRTNPITLEEEWSYPFYRWGMKVALSGVTLLTMVILVLACTTGVIVFRSASNFSNWFNSEENNELYTSVVSSVINAITIMLLGFVYEKIAYYLTDWENHRTQTNYDDHLIMKLFAFQFVNNYSSLFYIALIKDQTSTILGNGNWTDTCEYENFQGDTVCYPSLMLQVAILLCMKPMPKFFKDVILPTLLHFFKKFRKRFRHGDKYCCCCMARYCSAIRPDNIEAIDRGPEKANLTDIIEEDRELIVGDNDFTLSEYTEKTIMYGMIMLFGAVFPLAPLIALICNLVDVRVDGYRILWKNRRYIAQRVEDLGIWQYILEFLNIAGVVINSLIIAHTLTVNGSFLDQFYHEKWGIAFIFEHVCFMVKFTIAYVIPDIPSDVQFKMRKEHYHINKLFESGTNIKESTTTTTTTTNIKESTSPDGLPASDALKNKNDHI